MLFISTTRALDLQRRLIPMDTPIIRTVAVYMYFVLCMYDIRSMFCSSRFFLRVLGTNLLVSLAVNGSVRVYLCARA